MTSMIEFREWPKIARLFRDCTITEKLDGTNSAIGIVKCTDGHFPADQCPSAEVYETGRMVWGRPETPFDEVTDYFVYTQSRTRMISSKEDNYGFAQWVQDNASTLVEDLGEGLHFGEWWGSGIQKRYGGYLEKGQKYFSLFNTKRWKGIPYTPIPGGSYESGITVFKTPELRVVPVLYEGMFNTYEVQDTVEFLRAHGSIACPGAEAEGVVVYHKAANTCFKVTLEKDNEWKGKSDGAP